MKSENNAKALVEAITKLGLPESLGNELRLHLCFKPDRFCLHHHQVRGQDLLRFVVYIQKEKSTEEYVVPFYEACLQKAIEIPSFTTGETHSLELEKKMSEIDWNT